MKVNPRIFGAFLVGTGLIAGAYFLAPTHPTELDATVEVVAGVAPARDYIKITDSDHDGIPDWQEDFGSAQTNRIELPASNSEPYTPPDTLTGQLAIDLVTRSVQSNMYGPLGPNQDEIVAGAMATINATARDELYTLEDIRRSSNNSVEAHYRYGNSIAEIIMLQTLPESSRGEIEILQQAIRTDSPEMLTELTPIIDGYKNLIDVMLALTVPSDLATEHLNLLNSYHALLTNIEAMEAAFTDPLYSLVRLKRYHDDATALVLSMQNLFDALAETGTTYRPSDPAIILNVLNN